MGIDSRQLKIYIIEPILTYLELNAPSAINLVLGTAAQESQMGQYIKQVGFNLTVSGGGLGIYQMEIATAKDIIKNFLQYKPDLLEKVCSLYTGGDLGEFFADKSTEESVQCLAYNLIGNLLFSTAMCRVHYYRIKSALPSADDVEGLGEYWKKYYNTELGKGTVEAFVKNYMAYVC